MTLIIINDEYLEMNIKNCDNYLWLNYKNATFNMALDKVNEEVIKKPEMNKIIKEIKTDKPYLEERKLIINFNRLNNNILQTFIIYFQQCL